MSDSQHPHDDHGHEHGHDHDHDEPDHGVKEGEIVLKEPASGKAVPEPVAHQVEDAGTRALADALKSSFAIVRWLMMGLVGLFIFSGVFTVGPQERAIILRFGKPRGAADQQLLGPGLHFALPRPIDEVVKIPATQTYLVRSTIGFYNWPPEMEAAREKPAPAPSLNPMIDGYVLSGDANIMHVRATVRYTLEKPVDYVFQFVSASNTVQHALDSAVVYASAQFPVDDALRLNQAGYRERITARLNQLVAADALGIRIDPVDVLVEPPLVVKPAFDAALAAEAERSKAVNGAHGYANALLSKAEGEAKAVVNQGEADRSKIVKMASSEAKYFQDRLPEFERNPELFRERLLTESMSRILTNAQDKFFLPASVGGASRELRILLNREPSKPPQPVSADPGAR
jgi:membrane protease subunit HflK